MKADAKVKKSKWGFALLMVTVCLACHTKGNPADRSGSQQGKPEGTGSQPPRQGVPPPDAAGNEKTGAMNVHPELRETEPDGGSLDQEMH